MRPEAAYLRLAQNNWRGCLDDSLAGVRSSWHGDWVGLPHLLARCAEFLGLQASRMRPTSQVLLDAALEVANRVEQDAACAAAEPAPGAGRESGADAAQGCRFRPCPQGSS